jgi:uncharacterized membrane protein
MNKRVLVPILLVVALICLGYAIYRSTIEQVITTQNGSQVIYNQPQHGFLLGLCILAGMCIVGAVALLYNERDVLAHSHTQAAPQQQPPVITTSSSTDQYNRRGY